jgi:hypothetical protein
MRNSNCGVEMIEFERAPVAWKRNLWLKMIADWNIGGC